MDKADAECTECGCRAFAVDQSEPKIVGILNDSLSEQNVVDPGTSEQSVQIFLASEASRYFFRMAAQ
jgi:hypothetical protein